MVSDTGTVAQPTVTVARALPTIRQLPSHAVSPHSHSHTPPHTSPLEHPSLMPEEVSDTRDNGRILRNAHSISTYLVTQGRNFLNSFARKGFGLSNAAEKFYRELILGVLFARWKFSVNANQ